MVMYIYIWLYIYIYVYVYVYVDVDVLSQPNPKGLKVQTFPLQKMGYPSPEEAPPNPGLPYPILNLPEKFKSWLFAGQGYSKA